MPLSGQDFIHEIQEMVLREHSKYHPGSTGFVVQFYLFFPEAIAAMLGRCPNDRELERMLIDNVVEEGTGGFTGIDSHRGLYLRFSNACRCTEEELDQVEPLPETRTFLDWRELLIYERSGWSSMAIRAFVRSALQLRQKLSQWARLVLGGT